jgi:hypothetical protein
VACWEKRSCSQQGGCALLNRSPQVDTKVLCIGSTVPLSGSCIMAFTVRITVSIATCPSQLRNGTLSLNAHVHRPMGALTSVGQWLPDEGITSVAIYWPVLLAFSIAPVAERSSDLAIDRHRWRFFIAILRRATKAASLYVPVVANCLRTWQRWYVQPFTASSRHLSR